MLIWCIIVTDIQYTEELFNGWRYPIAVSQQSYWKVLCIHSPVVVHWNTTRWCLPPQSWAMHGFPRPPQQVAVTSTLFPCAPPASIDDVCSTKPGLCFFVLLLIFSHSSFLPYTFYDCTTLFQPMGWLVERDNCSHTAGEPSLQRILC